MANIKSQIKRNKQNVVRQERNKAVRSELRTREKNAVSAATEGAENADDAARRNSRLAKRLAAAKSEG